MSELTNLLIGVDTSEGMSKLDQLENRVNNTKTNSDNIIDNVNKNSDSAWLKALSIGRSAYGLLNTVLSWGGAALDQVTQAAINAVFTSIGLLTPIFTAQALTVGGAVRAGIGFTNLGIGLVRAQQAQQQQQINTAQNRLTENLKYVQTNY